MFIASTYLQNTTLEEFEFFLSNLDEDLEGKVIIAGDFNTKSLTWGSALEDHRGRLLADWISSRNMTAANVGDKPTFQRDDSQSIIDVTFTSDELTSAIREWRVLDEESLSLHNYIGFKVTTGAVPVGNSGSRRGGFSPSMFVEIVRRSGDDINLRMEPEDLTRLLSRWQDRSRLNVRVDSQGCDVYWWTEEIQSLRSQALTARRQYTRARGNRSMNEEERERLGADYRERRNLFRKAIFNSKNACWDRLCQDLEHDVWGAGYTIVRRSLKRNLPRVDLDSGRRAEIVGDLFPETDKIAWRSPDRPARAAAMEDFTIAELRLAADRLKPNRAPGPDGVLPETVKAVVKERGEPILGFLNGLLHRSSFPRQWKRAKLVLIPKPGRDNRKSNGFRPICLLDTMGKLYEATILGRIEEELAARGPLDDGQFGFRKGRSTVAAIEEVVRSIRGAGQNGWRAFVLLDVRNAFNTARWYLIVDGLLRRGINPRLVGLIKAYFWDRRLQIDGATSRDINVGVPQGPIRRRAEAGGPGRRKTHRIRR